MSKQKNIFDSQHPDYVSSLDKGLLVLLSFNDKNKPMSLSEVAEKTNLSSATARRFLLTLTELGYIKKDNRSFSLTPKTLLFGANFLSGYDKRIVIQHYLEELSKKIHESVSFAILDGYDIVYLARAEANHRLMSINLAVGTRLPAAYTSIGRVIIAKMPIKEQEVFMKNIVLNQYTKKSILDKKVFVKEIEKINQSNFCIIDQELDNGLRSIAVPIYSSTESLLGAINISTNAMNVKEEILLSHFLPMLNNCAAQLKPILY